MTLCPTLPPMPLRDVALTGVASGPSEIICRPADGTGCGRFLACVREASLMSPDDLSVAVSGEQVWECWTCWRAVRVRWSVAP